MLKLKNQIITFGISVLERFSSSLNMNISLIYLFFQQNIVHGLPLVNYPDVCTNSPEHGKAFCNEHVEYLNEKHPTVPTGIRDFLRYCGVNHDNTSTCTCVMHVTHLV